MTMTVAPMEVAEEPIAYIPPPQEEWTREMKWDFEKRGQRHLRESLLPRQHLRP